MKTWYPRTSTRPLVLWAVLFHGLSGAYAQPSCSIQINNDTTICQGQTVQLNGPAGYSAWTWNTGASSQNITVGTAGTYWCQVSYPSPELITNGNFSAGNTGFTSQFTYSNVLTTDGNYWIGTNAALYHPQFSGTGTGNFMMINSGWPSALYYVWCQDVVVCPQQTYTLSYRARTLSNATPARLQWWIDGVILGPEVNLPAFGTGWQTITQTWTTNAGQTAANICLRAMSGDGIGNDIGLDDLSLTGNIVLRDSVNVSVTPLPVFDLGPTTTLCTGQSLTLDASVPGGTYLWQNGSTNNSFNVTSPGLYTVMVTANSCSATDNVLVNYNPMPVVNLGPDLTLCSGQSTTLTATVPGATYTWQNGSTASTFNVTGPGTYSVGVLLNGCLASDAIDISYNPTPVVNLGADVVICAGAQVTLDATTPGATYLWSNGSVGPTLNTSTAGPYSVGVTVNGCTGTDAVNVSVTPLPVVNIGPDQTVCPGTPITLVATTPGGSYLWSDGSANSTLTTSTPGNYSVQVTVNGCSSSDAMVLTNHVLPVFNLGPDQTICAGPGAAAFTATVPGATYLWNTGNATNSIQPTTAGTYWLDVTTNGCTVRDSIDLFVTPLPVIDLGADLSVCPGINATLNATTASATYLWNTGAVTPTISVGPGAYSVQVTVNGCPGTDAINVGSFLAAVVDLGPDLLLCPGDDFLLDVTQAGAGYLWQDGSTNGSYLVQSGGPITVQLTTANGCIANDALTATYATPTAIDLGPDASICAGAQLTLDATVPGATYLWSNGSVTPTINVSTTGVYSVVVTQGSCTVTDAINVNVVPIPVINLGADQSMCTGDAITLGVITPGVSYLWNTGAVTPTINVTQGGTYSVALTNGAGCSASDAVNIIEATPDAMNLGPDITLCQGQSIQLNATLPGASYVWSTGAITPTITTGTSGTYWVQATQGLCSVSDTVAVVVNATPTVNLGSDLTLCAGDDITLDATFPGASYLWSTGAFTPTIIVNSAATYSVVVDLNGCTASDAINVGVLSLSALNLGPDVSLCSGQTVTLDATMPGVSYLWSSGAITPTITTGTSGTYWVQATQGLCSVNDTVAVVVNATPTVNLGSDLTLCAGDDVTLDATNLGATYLWSTGAITSTIIVNSAATYSVVVDLNGCTASDAINVGVLSLSALNLGPDVSLCSGQTVTLDATMPGVSYLWSSGAITPTITTGTSGTYWVQATQGLCSVSDTVAVVVNATPTVNLGSDLTLCAGDDAVLNATYPGATYLWSTGAITSTIIVNSAVTYSVVVDLNGCTASDAINVGVLSLSALNLGPDISLCSGQTVTLDATMPGVSYLWSSGAITPTITTGTSGTYWVQATQGLCSVSDTVAVVVNATPTVNLGSDLTLCAGDDVTLDATFPGASYLWSTGAVTPTITVNTAATYSVVVDLNGCTASDAINVGVLSPAGFDLGPDVQLCAGDQVVFALGIAGANYLWSTGAVTSSISVNTTSTVWVQVSQGICSASDTVEVFVAEPGAIDLGGSITACEGTMVTLDATLPGATYLWNTGAITAQLAVTTSGTYSVVASVAQCTVTDEVVVTIVPLPVVEIGGDQSFCPGASAIFNAAIPGATYLWQDGSTGASYITSASEPVSVIVTVNGCSASDAAQSIVLTAPVADLGNDTTICEGAALLLDVTQNGATYLWNDGSVDPTATITIPGAYSVTVELNGCSASDAINVAVFIPSALDLGADQLICPGETVPLATNISGQHLWSTGSTAGSITATQGGVYWVRVQVAACVVSDTITINMVPLVTPDLGNPLLFCEGDSAILQVEPNGATVLWSTGSHADAITVTTSGNYGVVLSLLGCTTTDAVAITVLEFVDSVSLGSNNRYCPGYPLVLDLTIPLAQYVWSTGATGSSISVEQPGTYSVTVTGQCIEATASIEVVEGVCDPIVYVPNTFTPNGDGRNEVFRVEVYGALRDFQLDIFDRWGERIHASDDPSVTWDGTYHGQPVQDGVYVWKVRYRAPTDNGPVARELIGHVTVLR